MKKVIYTAIIGGYDKLIEPTFKPEGWDFVCFSDRDLKSDIWEIRKTIPLYSDNTRTARKHKLLTHRFLSEYDISLWIDGNINVVGDVNDLLSYLDNCNYATYDHLQNKLDPRNCIYQEGQAILNLGKQSGNYKDNPNLIVKQLNRYLEENYPQNNGLVVQMQVLRRHNEKDVIRTMEEHWLELKHNSKREQLSFNYIAWKEKLNFNYIQGDSRQNNFFIHTGKHKGK